ncbi:hypothetical protein SEA_EDEN_60 [Microbacterium phage Eden]|uniref:Lipoprotein n=1 Tax=Microbacterium phage Eden TaxID=2250289 RepID=A0A345KWF3_9CAUD|nr:membrane protein [Microbacterium phage Eden]AXH47355.1 hypothetical protein SEA_EDEN_60 [Microbacterium phage Eden]
MKYILAIAVILIGIGLAFAACLLLAFLLLAFVAAPSFWGAFWLVAIFLVIATGTSKAL